MLHWKLHYFGLTWNSRKQKILSPSIDDMSFHAELSQTIFFFFWTTFGTVHIWVSTSVYFRPCTSRAQAREGSWPNRAWALEPFPRAHESPKESLWGPSAWDLSGPSKAAWAGHCILCHNYNMKMALFKASYIQSGFVQCLSFQPCRSSSWFTCPTPIIRLMGSARL